ncbi:MAG: 50S ribosomal protein L32e [Sulfolobales archaeon]
MSSYEEIVRESVRVRELLEEKRKIQEMIREKDKPEFRRSLWWKFPKFKNDPVWRKPKGNDNKMRLRLKGYPPIVEIGYRTDKRVRGRHPSGLYPVVVYSEKDIERLDPSKHIVYIGSTVGLRKRLELVKILEERGFRIANRGE